jgi:hypothetical protein
MICVASAAPEPAYAVISNNKTLWEPSLLAKAAPLVSRHIASETAYTLTVGVALKHRISHWILGSLGIGVKAENQLGLGYFQQQDH